MRNSRYFTMSLLIPVLLLCSCELSKNAGDPPDAPCADADPVFKLLSYDSLWQWGVPHVDSLEGGYRVFTAKWDIPTMMCPGEEVRVTVAIDMATNQVRPITVRASLELQFGTGHREEIPLTDTDGRWTNTEAPDPWSFLPTPYYLPDEAGYMAVYVDYLLPASDNFFTDLDYLYAHAEGVLITCDYTGWGN